MTETDAERDVIVIERSFDAPRALIWQMWTDPEHFAQWYGPDGAAVPVARMDVRVGGSRLVCMEVQTPDGPLRMWFTGEYREVVEHRRLVYTDAMSDPDGNVLTPDESGLHGAHPTVTEVTVELGDDGEGTTMVLTHVGIPADSPGAAGWEMALAKLAGQLDAGAAR